MNRQRDGADDGSPAFPAGVRADGLGRALVPLLHLLEVGGPPGRRRHQRLRGRQSTGGTPGRGGGGGAALERPSYRGLVRIQRRRARGQGGRGPVASASTGPLLGKGRRLPDQWGLRRAYRGAEGGGGPR